MSQTVEHSLFTPSFILFSKYIILRYALPWRCFPVFTNITYKRAIPLADIGNPDRRQRSLARLGLITDSVGRTIFQLNSLVHIKDTDPAAFFLVSFLLIPS